MKRYRALAKPAALARVARLALDNPYLWGTICDRAEKHGGITRWVGRVALNHGRMQDVDIVEEFTRPAASSKAR